MIHVVSVRVGTKYGPEYVAILHDMVARNMSTIDQTHWCLTDDPDSLPEGVNPIPARPDLPGWWQKVYLFSKDMPWTRGDRVVFFDLDVCITGRLEDFAERKGIMRDAGWPCYNSSVMSWDHGEHREIWSWFDPAIMTRAGSIVPAELLPKGQINGADQEWMTEVGGWDYLPADWCVSYKFGGAIDWPPSGCKVVVLHGDPKPHEITEGWVPNVWKLNGYTSLPAMRGCNTTVDARMANVRANSLRDLPWFTGFREREQVVAVVCGGPSTAECLPDIRAQRRRGAKIVTVNNAMAFLLKHGIKPDVHVMLDARAENAEFVKDAPEGVRYLIASQCHPDVFDALKDREVIVWHNGFGDNEEMREALDPWWEGENQRPCVLVPGGTTVGLRALWLCQFSGYRKIHVYGMDSCYHEDVHHAYPQPLNDGESLLDVTMGDKVYRCAKWMARQATEFQAAHGELAALGVQLWVHGRGLIPDIARNFRLARAA
jgi:uncharacterized Rossmann fold enzyme